MRMYSLAVYFEGALVGGTESIKVRFIRPFIKIYAVVFGSRGDRGLVL
jgi:hypothetical protein